MARNSYADYLKTIPAGAVGADGLLAGPGSGVNYMAEGMTPQQFYDFMTQQVPDPMARDGADGGYRDRGVADASWIPGAQKTGAKGEAWKMLAAMVGGTALAGGYGAAAGGGATMGGVAPGAGSTIGGSSAIGNAELFSGMTGADVAGMTALPSDVIGAGSTLGGSGGALIAGNADKAALFGSGGYGAAVTPAEMAATSGGGLLDSAGQWLKDNPTLAKIGGAVLGGLANSKDTQNTNTQSTDPWAPAQPYLLDNLKTNAAMQEYYRANPFSNEQKAAYQGLLDTVANNKANAAPMTANANSFMQSKRGVMPAMQGLLSGTQAAPIDWNAYTNIGRK